MHTCSVYVHAHTHTHTHTHTQQRQYKHTSLVAHQHPLVSTHQQVRPHYNSHMMVPMHEWDTKEGMWWMGDVFVGGCFSVDLLSPADVPPPSFAVAPAAVAVAVAVCSPPPPPFPSPFPPPLPSPPLSPPLLSQSAQVPVPVAGLLVEVYEYYAAQSQMQCSACIAWVGPVSPAHHLMRAVVALYVLHHCVWC